MTKEIERGDSFFSMRPVSPRVLHDYPSSQSFQISGSNTNDDVTKNTNNNYPNNIGSSSNMKIMELNKGKGDSSAHHTRSGNDGTTDESSYSDSFLSDSFSNRDDNCQDTKHTSHIVNKQSVVLDCALIQHDKVIVNVGPECKGWLPCIYPEMLTNQKEDKNPSKLPIIGKKPNIRIPRKLPKRGNQQPQAKKESYTSRRVFSSHRLKIRELQNQIEMMKTEMKDVAEENKLLKRLQHKHEKELSKFDSQENELSLLLVRHGNEVATLKSHLRKCREKLMIVQRSQNLTQNELHKANQLLAKYKEIAENNDLLERHELQQRISNAENESEEKQNRIDELERYVQNLVKTHKHQLHIGAVRQKSTQKQLECLQISFNDLQIAHKEKEKELDIRNIYSNRITRPPQRLPVSYGSSPLLNMSTSDEKLYPLSQVKTDTSPRQRAQEYARKLREEDMKRKAKRREKLINQLANTENFHPYLMREEPIEVRDESLNEPPLQDQILTEKENEINESNNISKVDAESDEQKCILANQKQEAYDWQREIILKKQQREEKERIEEEKLRREENLRQLEEKRRLMEEELANQRRRESEKIQEQKNLEKERKKVESFAEMDEALKRKEDLLAKMKELDMYDNDGDKPDLIDDLNSGDSDKLHSKFRKNYIFSSVTENLHQGKPATDDISVPPYLTRMKRSSQSSDMVEPSSGLSNKQVGLDDSKSDLLKLLLNTNSNNNSKYSGNGYIPSQHSNHNDSSILNKLKREYGPPLKNTDITYKYKSSSVADTDTKYNSTLPPVDKPKNIYRVSSIFSADSISDEIDEEVV